MTRRSKRRVRAATEKIKRWRGKKPAKTNVPTIYANFLAKELGGNALDRRNKPVAWVSRTQMGMDKIGASSNVGKYFVDFASTVTVHGFNHLTAPHRHPVERFLAVASIGGAFACLILLSLNFWDRYQNEATILNLDRDYKQYQVIRPAVVFCPTVRVDKFMFPEVFKRHGIEDTSEAREFFTFIANATYLNFNETPAYTAVEPEKWLTIIWELKNKPIARDVVDGSYGTWIVTERGICQIFCSIVAEYISYAYWMKDNWTIVPELNEAAKKFTYADREVGQSFVVDKDSVQVSVYGTEEIPLFEKPVTFVPFKTNTIMNFQVQEIDASSEVKSLSFSQRKCKTLLEGGLTMSPVYSLNMCILECKYQLIRTYCGCYPFFARSMPGIPVCGAIELRCIAEHGSKLVRINESVTRSCGCYPNCDTSYFKEISSEPGSLEMAPSTMCNIQVEFPLQKVRREILFSFNDFLASVGGAAGLFLGGSVVSFAEFFYWATLRLCRYRIDVRREDKRKRAVPLR